MGRNKTSQRTKGNEKPSSSSRSAQLNGGTGGFIGFSGVNYVPAASQIEDEHEIAAEFRITLRKLEKKDPITKLKGLQEFFALCEDQDIDTLKSVLPFWPRLYSKLCLDCNENVRADAQQAHHTMVNKIKKDFRPYLKAVMPVWLLVMSDPNSCVAMRAKKAFEDTFSVEKRPDALIYCAEEIVKYLADNILVQTSQTLADKNSSIEESDSKYCRIVCCSLKSLGLFLKILKSSTKPAQVGDKINDILKSEKFWSFSKHKYPQIKAAWFNLVSVVIEHFTVMDQECLLLLSKSIFSSLNCPDANVLPNIWRCLLLLCLKLPTCWNHCNKPESVCSSILAVLRDGGRGYAFELYPMLKPLLKLIPDDVIKNSSFHTNFFKAISSSLRKNDILANREEAKAIISEMFQCISYLHKQNSLTPDQWQSIITYQIIGHLKESWTENPLLKDSCLYREVAQLLSEWSELETGSDKLSKFWELFLTECNLIIENNNELELLALISIFENFSGNRTRSRKFVEFIFYPHTKSDSISPNFVDHVSQNIVHLTKNTYDSYVTRGKKCFRLFCCLMTNFPSNDACIAIIGKQSANVMLDFCNAIILPMMNKDSNFDVYDSAKLFLHLYKTLNESDRRSLLFAFKPTISTKALILVVTSFSKMVPEDEVASSWLKSAQLGCRAVKEMQDIFALESVSTTLADILTGKEDAHSLIRFIFSSKPKTDVMFSNEYLNQMVKVMRVTLAQKNSQAVSWNTIHLTISLLGLLLDNCACWKLPETVEVFCILLNHFWICSPDASSQQVLKSFIQKCFNSYVAGSKSEFVGDIFLCRFLAEIKNLIYNDNTSFTVVSSASEVVCDLLRTLFQQREREDCDIMLDHSYVRDIFENMIPTENEWLDLEKSLCKEYATPILCSQTITFCDFPFQELSLKTESFSLLYPKMCLFVVEVLTPLASKVYQESAYGACSNISLGEYTELCIHLLHGECYINEMVAMFVKCTKHDINEDLEYGARRLHNRIADLLQMVNTGNKKHMVKLFRNRCKPEEYLWPISMMKSLQSWLQVDFNAIKLIRESPNDANHSVIIQILAPFLTDEERAELLCEKVLSLKKSEHYNLPVTILAEINCLFQSLAAFWASAMVKDIFEILRDNKESRKQLLSSNVDLTRDELPFTLCLTRMLSSLVYYHKKRLSQLDWDFTLCHLSATVSSLNMVSLTSDKSCGMGLLICAVSNFALVIFKAMAEIPQEMEAYPPEMWDEWDLVYSQNVYRCLYQLLIECSEYYNGNFESVILYEVCHAISKSLHFLPLEILIDLRISRINTPPEIAACDQVGVLLFYSGRLMRSSHLFMQLVSYSFMQTIQPNVVLQWEHSDAQEEFEIPELTATCLKIIEEAEIKIESYLNERTEEEKALEIHLVPHTSEYCCWISYLLSFSLVFSFCKAVSEKNQQKFASYFGKKGHLHTLLNNLLFILLPFTPNDEYGKDKIVDNYFTEDFDPSKIDINNHTLRKLAARNFLQCLSLVPAETRYWFLNLEKSALQSVEKLTRTYVSPIIINNEFKLINEASDKFDNMSIKTKEKIGEVVATYTIDDTKLDLVLTISPKHPLAPVVFDHSKISVAASKWRGLNRMLVYRNTTLLNSLIYWKKNVDDRFEGVEECFICYSILKGANNQVPKMTCRTCKNKFHSACLYVWFDTAHNTTCPICRSPF